MESAADAIFKRLRGLPLAADSEAIMPAPREEAEDLAARLAEFQAMKGVSVRFIATGVLTV